MRTNAEIVARVKDVAGHDWMGIETNDLLVRLSFEAAKPFLRDDCTEADWAGFSVPMTREYLLNEMLEYMPFAWEKANDHRGLSAGRSMSHYRAWIWLLGDELDIELMNYSAYGKNNLVAICEKYGWDHTQWDDGDRSNS